MQLWALSYKYQHVYLPVLYGLLGLKFRLQDFTYTYMRCDVARMCASDCAHVD